MARSERLSQTIDAMSGLFMEIEMSLAKMAEITSLNCPKECGACCENPNIELSMADWLPLLREWPHRGGLEELHAKLEALEAGAFCVFLEPYRKGAAGRCGIYAQRPLICRLFAYGFRRSKNAEPELSQCQKHQELFPEALADFKSFAKRNPSQLLYFSNYQMRLDSIAPSWAQDKGPINLMLKKAIEKFSLLTQLSTDAIDETIQIRS